MESQNPEPGATPDTSNQDTCKTFADGKERHHGYHRYIWVWKDNVWTDDVVCTTCGKIEKRVREGARGVTHG